MSQPGQALPFGLPVGTVFRLDCRGQLRDSVKNPFLTFEVMRVSRKGGRYLVKRTNPWGKSWEGILQAGELKFLHDGRHLEDSEEAE